MFPVIKARSTSSPRSCCRMYRCKIITINFLFPVNGDGAFVRIRSPLLSHFRPQFQSIYLKFLSSRVFAFFSHLMDFRLSHVLNCFLYHDRWIKIVLIIDWKKGFCQCTFFSLFFLNFGSVIIIRDCFLKIGKNIGFLFLTSYIHFHGIYLLFDWNIFGL